MTLYNDYSTWIRQRFPYRVQKITIDAGLSCPNRDGRIGWGGCVYCNNLAFHPSYCKAGSSIKEQLEAGKTFFGRKYSSMKYLAYYQSYSNTYGELSKLRRLYEDALAVDDVVGIIVGTRPDCITEQLLDYFAELSKHTFVMIEYGIESTNDDTLYNIKRGHTFDCARRAVELTAERGVLTGGHIILGLPGESRESMLHQAVIISKLPLDVLKIHHLQVIKDTLLAKQYELSAFHVLELDEYIQLLAEYIRRLRPSLVLERFVSQSPSDMLIAPRWGFKPEAFTKQLVTYMKEKGIRQGDKYVEER